MSEPRVHSAISRVVIYRPVESADAVLAEGGCPSCGDVLVRQETRGWCLTCEKGWSLNGDTVGVHLDGGPFHITSATLR